MSKIDRIIDKELTWADNSMSLPMRLVKIGAEPATGANKININVY